MAIRVTLDRVLLDRRMSLTELGEKVGITLANLSILKTGKAKAIRFSTLEALCRELNCQPGDILVWDPDVAAEPDRMDETASATSGKPGRSTIAAAE
jgi:putative transcriptional regulator